MSDQCFTECRPSGPKPIRVPDAASFAAVRVLTARLFRRVGGATGINFYDLLSIAAQMRRGALVTLVCDSGEALPLPAR